MGSKRKANEAPARTSSSTRWTVTTTMMRICNKLYDDGGFYTIETLSVEPFTIELLLKSC